MPVTRSQKDAPSRPGSRPSDKDATGEMSGSEGSTSASASASSGTATTSDYSGTATTEDTTTTETTVATATTATTAASKDETAQKEMTQKTPEDIPDKGVHGSATTLKPKGVSRRARSTKTTSSSARRRELKAREELARMELKQAQAGAKLARIRLELAQCEDEDSVDEDQEDRTAQVQNWIETLVLEENNMGKHEQRGQHPPEEPNVKPEENSLTKIDTSEIQALTIALKEALTTRGGSVAQPSFLRKEEAHWPAPRTFKKTTTDEEKAADVAATTQTFHPSPDPERFSSWKRLWRATARVPQFLQLCRKGEKVNICKNDPTWKITQRKGTKTVEKQHRSSKITERKYIPMDTELLEKAETLLLKRSQDNSFREDIKRLQQGKQLEGSSKLKRLDVVLEEGLLRLKGRIDAIQGVTRDYKRPIVLDSKDKTTQFIIEEFHCRSNHGNHATVMNEIRQRFWILGLRI
ncbi:unnamed protein product [Parnassius apollo]|uniref:(apollo) hypothetical protein n=1 Tax=Parnassius apollo TaxID=110799 RepID=A0A8S3XB45_PARAO|nr:unnamed protein product [Parnassius apollo]